MMHRKDYGGKFGVVPLTGSLGIPGMAIGVALQSHGLAGTLP